MTLEEILAKSAIVWERKTVEIVPQDEALLDELFEILKEYQREGINHFTLDSLTIESTKQ